MTREKSQKLDPLAALSPAKLALCLAWVADGSARAAVAAIARPGTRPRTMAARVSKLRHDPRVLAALPIVALAQGRPMPTDAGEPRIKFNVAAHVARMA